MLMVWWSNARIETDNHQLLGSPSHHKCNIIECVLKHLLLLFTFKLNEVRISRGIRCHSPILTLLPLGQNS